MASKIIALGVNTADTAKLYTSVGTISANGALSWGAVTTHTIGGGIGQTGVSWDAVRQSNNQLLLAYHSPSFLRARIIEYSGTTTTVGTETTTAVTNVTSTSSPVMNLAVILS